MNRCIGWWDPCYKDVRFEGANLCAGCEDDRTSNRKGKNMPRDDPNHMNHKFHKAIEAQLHLLDVDQLKEVLKVATSLSCPDIVNVCEHCSLVYKVGEVHRCNNFSALQMDALTTTGPQ